MTDPRRPEPVFAATRGTFEAIALRAAARRRTRAALTSLTATFVAVVAATVVTQAPGGASGLHPTTTYGAGSETPQPSPAGTPSAPESADPRETPPSAHPSGPADPSEPAEPGPSPSGTGEPDDPREPSPEPYPQPRPSGWQGEWPPPSPHPATGSPRPSPRSTSFDGTEEWTESVTTVADRPAEGCATPAAEKHGWCYRYTGPASATAGQPVTFTAELCRRTADGGDRVEFDYDVELHVFVDGPEQDAWSWVDRDVRPHERSVALGDCLRWTSTWNGIAQDSARARAGRYDISVWLEGGTPYVAGNGTTARDEHDAWADLTLT